MRTNLCPNPSAEVDTTGYVSNGDGVTITRDTTVSRYGSASVKSVPLGTNPATNLPVIPVTPGVTYTISFWLYAASGTATNNLIYGHNGSGYYFSAYVNPVGGGSFTPGVWQRWSGTFTAVTGDLSFIALIGVQSGAAGYFIDGVLVEASRTLLPYFDGDTINCQWAGTAGLSTSTWFSQNTSIPRRNLSTNPRGTAAGVGFGLNNVYWSVAYNQGVVGHPLGISTAVLVTVTDSVHAGTQVASMFNLDTRGDFKVARLVGAWVWSSVGGSALIYCGTGTGTTVPVPATTWTFVQMNPGTDAPGQCSLGFTKGSGNTVNGDYCFMTAVVSDPSGATLPYFDGDSVNSAWDGAVGISTSQQIAPPGLNPNLPVMGWRVWTGENPPAVPNNPTTKPLYLSDRARSFKVERGRQYELDQDQAGTAEVRLVNNDGAVIAGRNNMFPMRLGQFRVSYLGQTYVLYTGYVSKWPDQATDPATSESLLTFSDLTDALANRPLKTLIQETTLHTTPPPIHYFAFDEPAGNKAVPGSVGAIDALGTAGTPAYPVVPYKGGDPQTLVFGGSGLATNDGGTALANDNASGPVGKASQVRLGGPGVTGGISIDTTKPWLVLFYAKVSAGKTALFSILDNAGYEFASIYVDATGAGAVTWVAGGCTPGFYGVGEILTGCQIGIGWDGTTPFLVITGRIITLGGTYTPKGVLSWIAVGAQFSGTSLMHFGNSTYVLQHLAIWNGASIPDMTNTGPLYDLYHAFVDGYLYCNVPPGSVTSFDSTTTRISRLLGWAGMGGLAGDSSAVNIDAMPGTKGAAVIDSIRQATLNVWGRFFMSKGGLPTFHSKDWNQTQITPRYVFGGNAGEFPYTGGPAFEYDLVHTYNDVQVNTTSSVVTNAVLPAAVLGSVTNIQKGAIYRWVNQSSVGKYFTRVLQASMQFLFGTDALTHAQWLSNRYGEPDYRIGDIVLDPMGNPALWPVVLGIELDDVVQVNHRDLNGTRSGLFSVAKIRHEGDEQSWRTTLSLTPFHQYWLLAAMHTTLAASCLAGATSISLNPLPDSATNPSEASIGVGSTLQLEPGTGVAETVTIKSVTSAPTPGATGYTSITLGVSATAHAHSSGAVACDPLPAGVTDPTTWDARSVLGSTTILNA